MTTRQRIINWIKMIVNRKIIKKAGYAYCLRCFRSYTYKEYSELEHRKHYPQYLAYATICPDCKNETWRFFG